MDRSKKNPFLDREAGSYGVLDGGLSTTKQWMVAKLRRVGAEVLGTFFLMFAACGSIMAGWDVMGQAVTVAFALVMLISSLGPISGAHLNPAMSLAFAATKQFQWREVVWYIGGQVVGGTMAMWVVKEIYGASDSAALTQPSGGWAQSFFMEIMLSFSLAFIATATNILPNIDGIQGGVAIGLTVAMNMILGGETSGASMNPVRSLAPAIVQNNYKQLWIYIFAPIIGTTLGASSFQLIHSNPP